jgi:hypothetical protein
VTALRREEIGLLVMEMSENFWPEDLELAVLAVHDIARSRQNPLLLLVVLDSDFDTQLWDFLPQILQPGILVQNRPSRVAVLTPDPAKPKNHVDSEWNALLCVTTLRTHGTNQISGFLLASSV